MTDPHLPSTEVVSDRARLLRGCPRAAHERRVPRCHAALELARATNSEIDGVHRMVDAMKHARGTDHADATARYCRRLLA